MRVFSLTGHCLWLGLYGLLACSAQATDFGAAFAKADPAVVVIHTLSRVAGSKESEQGLGSGVVIDAEGRILTAAHVVHKSDALRVELRNGNRLRAQIVGTLPSADLALLKLEEPPESLSVAPLGDSDQVQVGQEVFVIGSPYGIAHTLTAGHISGRHTAEELGKAFFGAEFFQTDAAINPGNSGGPVFNTNGEVVGIVSHIETRSGGSDGLGFAVSSNAARKLMLERVTYWSGLDLVQITPELAQAINYPLNYGVLVQSVATDSGGHHIGLQGGSIVAKIGGKTYILGGDIIESVAGISLEGRASLERLRDHLGKMETGQEVVFEIFRRGNFTQLKPVQ